MNSIKFHDQPAQDAYTRDGLDEGVGTNGKKLNRQVRQGTESFLGGIETRRPGGRGEGRGDALRCFLSVERSMLEVECSMFKSSSFRILS